MDDLVRPLGLLERLYTARQVLGIYHSVIVTASYKVRSHISATLLNSVFSAVLPGVLERHPALCCYVSGIDTPSPEFRRLATIKTQDVVNVVDVRVEGGNDLAAKLQELHDRPWPTVQQPLWKIVVIREPQNHDSFKIHVAFVYHHVLGDGLSELAVQRSLRYELSSLKLQKPLDLPNSPRIINVPSPLTLTAPIESIISFPLSWSYLLQKVWQEYAPPWLRRTASPPWPGTAPQSLDRCPNHTRLCPVTYSLSNLEFMLSESKKNSVTLTSLLTASLVSILSSAIPSAQSFMGTTPYTLRRVTGTGMDEMVNQTSAFQTHYSEDFLKGLRHRHSNVGDRVPVQELWDIASYFHRQMQTQLAKCPKDDLLGLLPYISDPINFYEKKFGQAREVTFEMSNLGVFQSDFMDSAGAGDWDLEAMTFSQSAQPVGAAITVSCTSVKGGGLTLAITWQDSTISEDIIDVLARDLRDLPRLLHSEVV